MTDYRMQRFRGEVDYERMQNLLRSNYPQNTSLINCTVGDIDWWRSTASDPEIMQKVGLWETSTGELVAFTWPGEGQVDIMCHPAHRAVEALILEHAEAEYRQHSSNLAEASLLSCSSNASDTVRNELLQARGYRRSDEFFSFHQRSLVQLPVMPPLPDGYTIRSVQGEADLAERVAVHRAAFHPSRMTVEKHQRAMASSTYRQELDLVVVAPDGTFAAFTIVWLDDANQIGLFEPVGCHPEHQRRGLASAVMLEGMRRLQQAGATVAHVLSAADDSPGAHLYRALGFEAVDRIYIWEKQIN